tara:strand:+ start:4279 stop:5502 length:1224 start_codon:yes stop_codon:yes gene_type:complete
MTIYLDEFNNDIFIMKIWIKFGSIFDPKDKRGITNILTGMISRGCSKYNNEEIYNLIEESGAEYEYATNEEAIILSLKCNVEDSIRLTKLIFIMISSLKIDKNQLDLEKKLKIRSIERKNESHFDICFNKCKKLVFNGTSFANDPMGEIKDIENIKVNDLEEHINYFYESEKIISITINKYKNEIISLYNKYINAYKKKTNSNTSKNINGFINNQKFIKKYINSNQVVIMLGHSVPSHNNPEDLILRVISSHLSYGMTSLLFRKLREEKGLTYDLGIYHPTREIISFFILYISTSEEKAEETTKTLKSIWYKDILRPIAKEALDLAKSKLKGSIYHSLQTTEQRIERKTQLLAYGMDPDYDKNSIAIIDQITSDQIITTIEKYLRNPFISLSGPQKILKKLEKDFIY